MNDLDPFLSYKTLIFNSVASGIIVYEFGGTLFKNITILINSLHVLSYEYNWYVYNVQRQS